MTPERWKQTEELYHAARNQPVGERAAFLAEACPDDEALRLDIESLLNEPMSADGLEKFSPGSITLGFGRVIVFENDARATKSSIWNAPLAEGSQFS